MWIPAALDPLGTEKWRGTKTKKKCPTWKNISFTAVVFPFLPAETGFHLLSIFRTGYLLPPVDYDIQYTFSHYVPSGEENWSKLPVLCIYAACFTLHLQYADRFELVPVGNLVCYHKNAVAICELGVATGEKKGSLNLNSVGGEQKVCY